MYDKVVCVIEEVNSVSTGGIILPDSAKGKSNVGLVHAVGPGKHNAAGEFVATTLKPGDRVIFGQWSGVEVSLGGQMYVVFCEEDVIGKVRE